MYEVTAGSGHFGEVLSEPGEVPTMVASEPTDTYVDLIRRYWLERRVKVYCSYRPPIDQAQDAERLEYIRGYPGV